MKSLLTLYKHTLVVYLLVVYVLSITLIMYLIFNMPIQKSNQISPVLNTSIFNRQVKLSYETPVRLKIPVINVNATFEYVGLTIEGELDVPKNPANVGWFKLGPNPGNAGSSVIDGHFGWTNNIPAVFDSLNKLSKGDKIYVEDKKGLIVIFVVREIRSYDSKADASRVFTSSDGKAHLNLITCEGNWNKSQQSYSNRLVVFADKEM